MLIWFLSGRKSTITLRITCVYELSISASEFLGEFFQLSLVGLVIIVLPAVQATFVPVDLDEAPALLDSPIFFTLLSALLLFSRVAPPASVMAVTVVPRTAPVVSVVTPLVAAICRG